MGVSRYRVSAIGAAALNDSKASTLVACLEAMGAEIGLGSGSNGASG